jgi:amidohydrolase
MLDDKTINQLTVFRKSLHAHPELSGEEHHTQKEIIHFLEEKTVAKIQKVSDTGVMATFNGTADGDCILIRGDIDALPIIEVNDFDHRSTIEGVSHKCGHDGHTCILLGLAILLSKQPISKGKIIVLFQPAEETGMGAKAVLSDPIFKNITPDYVFALHNLPGYPKHEIVVKENEFTGNVKSIAILFNGKTAHAAEPEKGYNPSLAIAELLQYANQITINNPESKEFFLATPIHVNMGELAYGISAGSGEVHFTIRSWSTEIMKEKSEALVNYIQKLCAAHQLTSDLNWTQEFAANINDLAAVNNIRSAANINGYPITERLYPFKWGEDFGLFTQRFKGAMFGIGVGEETPALHNPDYDFPDEILATGINMFYQIIKNLQ